MGVLGPVVPSLSGEVGPVAGLPGWPRQVLMGKGPSVVAQSRGLGAPCPQCPGALRALSGMPFAVAVASPQSCPGLGAVRPDTEQPGLPGLGV